MAEEKEVTIEGLDQIDEIFGEDANLSGGGGNASVGAAGGSGGSGEVEQNPFVIATASTAGAPGAAAGFGGGPSPSEEAALDESVWTTLMRDVRRVATNTRQVLLPRRDQGWGRDALREWDLYGPALYVLALSALISIGHGGGKTDDGSDSMGLVFSVVFTTVAAGSVVITVNVKALGGTIMFFQSLSLLGYCIFPLVLAAALCLPVANRLWRVLMVLLGVGWSSYAAVPYVGAAVGETRRALAVYPFFLMALAIGWLTLVMG